MPKIVIFHVLYAISASLRDVCRQWTVGGPHASVGEGKIPFFFYQAKKVKKSEISFSIEHIHKHITKITTGSWILFDVVGASATHSDM
jgi:hypothetical protein